MLAMGRGLMGRPKLLLLDEPSMGLAPILVEEIFAFIKEINRRGTTILLVEQNAQLALAISHKACVLETGSIALAGSATKWPDGRIKEIYLGWAETGPTQATSPSTTARHGPGFVTSAFSSCLLLLLAPDSNPRWRGLKHHRSGQRQITGEQTRLCTLLRQ